MKNYLNKILAQSLPPYDPDGDGDNDAEEALMAIQASCVLMEYAESCLNGDMGQDPTQAKRLLGRIKAQKNVVLPFNKPTEKSILRLGAKSQDTIQMDMFGVIGGDFWGDGGITKEQFAKMLNGIPNNTKRVDLRMSSPGGDVFDGRAIANMMTDHPCAFDINVIAESSSIASIIAMAGDTIHMGDGAVMLVHRCYAFTVGNSLELIKLAKDLNTIDETMVKTYAKKTGMEPKAILSLMDENRYMSAQEAKDLGFVDSIANDNINDSSLFKIAAMNIDRNDKFLTKFHLPNLPKDFQPRRQAALAAMAKMESLISDSAPSRR